MMTTQLSLTFFFFQIAESNLGLPHVKAVYCHPAYLMYMESTS